MSDAWPTVSVEERVRALESAISRASMQGGRLLSRGQTEAVVEYGRNPNHVVHVILTVFTCGIWGVIWLIDSLASRPVRRTIVVDDWGRSWISDKTGMREF